MKEIYPIVKASQDELSKLVKNYILNHKGIQMEAYVRLLSMQYHLTKGVQKDMFKVASSSILAKYKSLRDFLYEFGLEEEMHYKLALKDLSDLGKTPLEMPLDVKLWKGYFSSICIEKPFIRLGGTCVLENITTGLSETILGLLKSSASEITKASRFIKVHLHTDVGQNHGDQILDALKIANLRDCDKDQLCRGAEEASIVYLRMIYWVMHGENTISYASSYDTPHHVTDKVVI